MRHLSKATLPPSSMPESTDRQIRSLVDTFVTDIADLIREEALATVREALGDGVPAPVRRGPGRPRKKKAKATRRKTGRRVRRSSEPVDAEAARALTYIKTNDGCSVGDIGDALGLSTKDLRLPLQKLLGNKEVRTTGQKRGTKYHAGGGRGPAKKKKATRKKAAKRKTAKKKGTRRKTTKRRRATKR